MSSFTCLNCSVRFPDAELQRQHYKTDWHRYNLKRKVAELQPVTAEEFQKRVAQQKFAEEQALQDHSLYCRACKKYFKTQNAHDNHLNSKKHKDNVKAFINEDDDQTTISIKATDVPNYKPNIVKVEDADESNDEGEEDAEEVDSDEWDDDTPNPIAANNCLFCNEHSEDLISNIKHMSISHSFFIPDAEFCTDIEGLLTYLGEKIFKDYICIWCNDKGKLFYSLKGVQNHMVDKGHCKMLHEGVALAEFADFYDYSSSYPDHDESMDVDEEVEQTVLDGDDYQLVLPSGIVIGHRSLMRYYKQRTNPNKAVVIKKSDRRLHKVLAEYRSLGWSETQQEAAARKARDIHAMKRQQAKLMQQVGVKANKLQKHYRPQVNF